MPLGNCFRHAALACAISTALVTTGFGPAAADAGFRKWIQDFYGTAAKSGITRKTYNAVFDGITDVDQQVIEKANYQPEFSSEIWDYLDARVTKFTVAKGQEMRQKYKRWLDVIERRYGVDRDVLLAIWSIETIYGDYLTRPDSTHHLGQALATLAYKDKRRAKFARTQLIAALKIVQNGDIPASQLRGSWAGAMGHTQFIPTSYQAYAVDFDRNGRRDIWSSIPDALATAANLLARNGWQSGETWGYEVVLPGGRKFPGGSMSLSKWASIGVVRANGKPFPRPSDKAELKVPDGREGPAFLMTKNFFVIKRYNNADKYAMAVGLLADQIAGYGGLVRDWNRPFTRLTFDETQELQKRLSVMGYYDGKIDGKIGEGSRGAIKAFQSRMGLTPDGHPSKEVLSNLRRQ